MSSTSRPHTPAGNDNHQHAHIPTVGAAAVGVSATVAATAAASSAAAAQKPAPLDRTNDTVYTATTSVVKAIMVLSHGVERAVAADYLELVKNVGFELRALLASVDQLSGVFPAQAHK